MNAINPLSSSTGDQRSHEPSMEEILASIRRIIADDQATVSRPAPRDRSSESDESPAAGQEPSAVHVLHAEPEPTAAAADPMLPAPPADRASPEAPGAAPAVEAPPARSAPLDELRPRSFEPRRPTGPEAAAPDSWTSPVPTTEQGDPEEEAHFAAPDGDDAPPATEADFAEDYGDIAIGHPTDAAAGLAASAHGLFSAQTGQSVSSAFNLLAATRLADNSDELLGLAREMIRPLLKTWLDDNLPSMVERLVRAEIERVARGGR